MDVASIAQQDRQPQGGYMPTTVWQAGQTITDRLAFLVPTDLDKTALRLRIGVVRSGNGTPEPVTDATGTLQTDPFVVLVVR